MVTNLSWVFNPVRYPIVVFFRRFVIPLTWLAFLSSSPALPFSQLMTSSHTLLQIKGSLQIQRMETTSSSHRQALTCLGCRLHSSLMGLKCPHHPPSQHLLMGSGFYSRTHFQGIPFFFSPTLCHCCLPSYRIISISYIQTWSSVSHI